MLWMVSLSAVPASALTIVSMDTPENLARRLIGTGVAISNVSYTGATGASGYFEGGTAAGIGIESGVVLTTGSASFLNTAENTSPYTSEANGLLGGCRS